MFPRFHHQGARDGDTGAKGNLNQLSLINHILETFAWRDRQPEVRFKLFAITVQKKDVGIACGENYRAVKFTRDFQQIGVQSFRIFL